MAVRAADRVTLAVLPAVTYARTYYLLRASNLSVPAKPTTNPPPAPWTATEPAFNESSTDTLYTVALTVYGTAGFEYGAVQVSSSYEAAKSAYNKAVSVLTIASGKNTINFSSSTPPTTGNADRVVGDIWWRRSGTVIIGQWMWTGSAWTVSPLRDEVISNLSVGKLVAGSGTINSLVSEKIWTEAVVAHLVEAERIITGEALVDGAVTARTLNIVHTDPTSGYSFKLDPAGLTITDNEGNTVIALRADMSNYFSVMKAGVSVASISPDGDITGRSIAANESLVYRSVELEERLEALPLGLVSDIATMNTNANVQTTMRAMMTINFTNRTSINRAVKVTAKLHTRNRSDHVKVAFYTAKSTTDEGISATLGSTVGSESNYGTVADGQNDLQHIQFIMNEPGETVSVMVAVKTNNSSTDNIIFSDHNTRMWAEDLGPWRPLDSQTPDTTGGSNDGTVSKKSYSKTFTATGHKTYSRTSLLSTRAAASLVQGAMAGAVNRGHWIFASTVRTALTGASDMTGSLTIKNQGTGSGSMTAVLKVHNYSSAPSTFGTVRAWTSVTVASGRDVTITLPSWILNELKAGTVKGFSLDHGTSTSISYYGYFSPSAVLKLNYKK